MNTWLRERRAHLRGARDLAAQANGDAWRTVARVANLGRKGACVVVERPGDGGPVEGDFVSVRFELPPDPRNVSVRGVVAWTERDGARIRVGLRFSAMDSPTVARIDRWVELVRLRAA